MKFYKKTIKILAVICISGVIISAFSGCSEKVTEVRGTAFGNDINFTFYSDDTDTAMGYSDNMITAIKETETDFSLEEGSCLSTLNETGTSYVSATLKEALEDSVIICTALADIVDITMGKPLRLWGFYSDSPAVPDDSGLKEAVDAHTMDKLVIARDSHKVTITDDMAIDMAPVAKGIALDAAAAASSACSIPYTVSIGDMSLAFGEGPCDGQWEISLRNPLSETDESFASIRISPKGLHNKIFISASGVWEGSFTENGRTYHSYLDPKTGYPCDNGLVSVSVVTESGITADALSDALLINGFSEKSLGYIDSFMAEAVFVFADKTYYVTEGLRDSFTLSDSSFSEHTEAPATELF